MGSYIIRQSIQDICIESAICFPSFKQFHIFFNAISINMHYMQLDTIIKKMSLATGPPMPRLRKIQKSTNRRISLVNVQKIIIIKLDLSCMQIFIIYTYIQHLQCSFNLTFRSQAIIWKPKIQLIRRTKRGTTVVKVAEKS